MPSVAEWTDTCEAIWEATLQRDREEKNLRKEEMVVRVLDGNWGLQHVSTDYYELDLNLEDNDTGTHKMVVPWEDPVVDWALDEAGRIDGREFLIDLADDIC